MNIGEPQRIHEIVPIQIPTPEPNPNWVPLSPDQVPVPVGPDDDEGEEGL